MADFKYTYSLSDFPNNMYNSDTLSEEIIDSSLDSTLLRIDGTKFDANIFFSEELSTIDVSTLDYVVSIHTGEEAADAENVEVKGDLIIKPIDVSVSTNFTLAAIDASGRIVNPKVAPSYYGQEFYLVSDVSIETTSSTTPITKAEMITPNLEAGLYKVTAGWVGSYTFEKERAIFDVTLNDVPIGARPEILYNGPKDGDVVMVFDRRYYLNLSGINSIKLRYWSSNDSYSTTISDAYLELIRIN